METSFQHVLDGVCQLAQEELSAQQTPEGSAKIISDLGFESLDAVSLALRIERRFGTTNSCSELRELLQQVPDPSLRRIAEMVHQKITAVDPQA